MSSMAATAGPYSAQLVTLYALLIADVVINATADANAEPLSRFSAISYLVIQLVVRVLCVFNTIGLLGSIPRLGEERRRLSTIEGAVPSPQAMPAGCRFHPRCPFADAQCRASPPPLVEIAPGHSAACWHAPVEMAAHVSGRAAE